MTNKTNRIFGYAIGSSIILMALLITSYFLKSNSTASLIITIAIILFQIIAPIEILKYCGISAREFNIYAHNIDTIIDILFPPWGKRKIRPHFSAIANELLVLFKVSLVIFIPYIICYWAYYEFLAIYHGLRVAISYNFPPRLGFEIITQIAVIALPEELFYRGFLQSALLKKWPNRLKIFGLPMGKAIIITNLIFAVAHVASTFSPLRLLTFFPGLIFSYLVYRNHSLLAAVLFHAACNILGQILYASLFLVRI